MRCLIGIHTDNVYICITCIFVQNVHISIFPWHIIIMSVGYFAVCGNIFSFYRAVACQPATISTAATGNNRLCVCRHAISERHHRPSNRPFECLSVLCMPANRCRLFTTRRSRCCDLYVCVYTECSRSIHSDAQYAIAI